MDYRRIAIAVAVVLLIVTIGYFIFPVLLDYLMQALLETLR